MTFQTLKLPVDFIFVIKNCTLHICDPLSPLTCHNCFPVRQSSQLCQGFYPNYCHVARAQFFKLHFIYKKNPTCDLCLCLTPNRP